MKIVKIVLACVVLGSVVAAGVRAASSKDDASNAKSKKGAVKPRGAEYCDRGTGKETCVGPPRKVELDTINKKTKADIEQFKKDRALKKTPFGIDSWQEIYLEGLGLEGRHFSLATGSGKVFPLSEGMVLKDSNGCDDPALQLKIVSCDTKVEPASCRVKVENGTGGMKVCGVDASVVASVLIVKGYWDDKGAWQEDAKEVTLSCNAEGNEANGQLPATDGALNRCLRYFDYKPAGKNESLTACIRMQRADFCGDGISRTYIGSYVEAHDAHDKINPERCKEEGPCFEATWSKDGAICVAHSRWTNLDYEAACGANFPDVKDGIHCRRGKSISNKDLFTRSRINTCGSEARNCGPDTVSPGCPPSADSAAPKGKKDAKAH